MLAIQFSLLKTFFSNAVNLQASTNMYNLSYRIYLTVTWRSSSFYDLNLKSILNIRLLFFR